MAGFQVAIIGRFWVATEDDICRAWLGARIALLYGIEIVS